MSERLNGTEKLIFDYIDNWSIKKGNCLIYKNKIFSLFNLDWNEFEKHLNSIINKGYAVFIEDMETYITMRSKKDDCLDFFLIIKNLCFLSLGAKWLLFTKILDYPDMKYKDFLELIDDPKKHEYLQELIDNQLIEVTE